MYTHQYATRVAEVYTISTMSSQKQVLSKEQQKIFDKITVERKNVFFTGCAGTGKSFLLKHIIQYYLATDSPESLAITASTGRAAFTIEGVTLHSFAGVGLGKEDIKSLINRATYNKKVANRWNSTRVLIIDEISMLDAEYFDKLDKISKTLRKSSKPFGGIQLIMTGDLLQLPPVNEGEDIKKRIFEADCWDDCVDEYMVLYEVFRQADLEFAEILTYIRLGEMSKKVIEFMEKVGQEKHYNSESGAVNLYSTKRGANEYNQENLDKIKEESRVYIAQDKYKKGYKNISKTLDNCPAVPSLELKVGAQVMLIKNVNKSLVNGTVGTVIGFTNISEGNSNIPKYIQLESLPIVRFDLADGRLFTRSVGRETWSQRQPDGEEIASRKQIPLILAWAVTIHKSQGQTIQRLKVDLSDIFESGQVYTALSRAVSPDTLEVIGFDPDKVRVDDTALRFCIEKDLI